MTRRALVTFVGSAKPGVSCHSWRMRDLPWPVHDADMSKVCDGISSELEHQMVFVSLAWLEPEPTPPLTLRQRVGRAAIAVVLVASVALDVAPLVW